jgi:outer membrane protein OmpA-like peptidoglycan-associated protein
MIWLVACGIRQGSRSAVFALVILLLSGLALVACGGSHQKKPTAGGSSTSTSTTTKRPVAASPPSVTTVDAAMTAGADLQPDRMQVTIYDIRREGPYVVLDFGVRCVQTNPNAGCGVGADFTAQNQPGSSNDNTPDGVRLVDPVAHKLYRPVRDSQDRPDASQMPPFVYDSLTHVFWVRYAAPPASVRALDVAFPNGGPQVANVPVSAGAGPVAGGKLVAAQAAPFDRPPDSVDTSGLKLGVQNLLSTVGNPTGSDQESASHATLTLQSDVLFRFDKATLTPRAHAILDRVAPQIKARAVGSVEVTGYTDSKGTDAINQPLSVARARAVVGALEPRTPGVGYRAAGMGSADPVAPNTLTNGADNPKGRALNRRVTIAFAVRAPEKPTPPPSSSGQAPPPQTTESRTVSFPTTVLGPNISESYRVTVDSLFRDGDYVVLKVTIVCASTSDSDNNCDGEFDFAGSNSVPPESSDRAVFSGDTYNTLSAMYLVDPATGSEYIPVRSTDKFPLVAEVNPTLSAGISYSAWAYFPAPPASTSALTVELPNGTVHVDNIPIAPSPPAP